jgi:oligoendopeptidase F
MRQLPELQHEFEQEIKKRMHTLDPYSIVLLVRLFSQAESASAEFYAIMDKQIGLHMSEGKNIEPKYLFVILKSFYDSGHARPKLFIKL